MTGYDHIRNMTDMEISERLQVNIRQAVQIRNSSLEELVNSEYICPQFVMPGHYKCMDKETICKCCRKEFLEEEIYGQER